LDVFSCVYFHKNLHGARLLGHPIYNELTSVRKVSVSKLV